MGEHRDDSGRKWLAIAVIFVAFWVLYLAFFGPKGRRPSLEGTALADPASFDWTLRDLKDQPATFAKFKGKPVFLNIWATWCGPCVREMPSIARLADEPRLKGKGIAFVCVSVDNSTEAVRQFVEGRSWHDDFLPGGQCLAGLRDRGDPGDLHHRARRADRRERDRRRRLGYARGHRTAREASGGGPANPVSRTLNPSGRDQAGPSSSAVPGRGGTVAAGCPHRAL